MAVVLRATARPADEYRRRWARAPQRAVGRAAGHQATRLKTGGARTSAGTGR